MCNHIPSIAASEMLSARYLSYLNVKYYDHNFCRIVPMSQSKHTLWTFLLIQQETWIEISLAITPWDKHIFSFYYESESDNDTFVYF